ncbi:MAG: helix-turn-helix domain-containing protein [Acidobacteria bacterium]|jgi:HTH-type transcriptional regulator/antitoxin HigA|nr:helix-turn-helix domain-containing protein [Acidobacteriota bacterium]
MTFNKQLYGVLLTDTLPVVIDSAAEYNRIESIFENLLDKENRSPEEDKLFDLLANLLEDYERRSLPPLAELSPLEALQFLMRENDLAQKDLAEFFGSKGIVSEVLSGKRSISKSQAKKLAARFCVSTDLFI